MTDRSTSRQRTDGTTPGDAEGLQQGATALDVLRLLSELAAFGLLAVWGFLGWAFPWNVVVGIGAPLLAILLWAFFVSPRAVVAVHPFARMIVELLVFVSATIALWQLGQGVAGIVFGVIAVLIGVLHNRKAA